MGSNRELTLGQVSGEVAGVAVETGPGAHTRIRPSAKYSLGLGELWEYRELVFFLMWRDIKIRYKQSVLGASWALIQPFLTMMIFSLFFGRLAKMPSDGIPYPIFCYAALVPWTLFSNGLVQGSNTLVQNASMVKKIYFPRLALPIATILAGLLDFILAFAMLLGMLLYFDVPLTVRALCWPLFLLLALATCTGVVLWLSSLNAKFRDIRYAVPFLAQIWLFSSPIAYPSTLLSEQWRVWYGLNPMVSVAEGFRWALLGTDGLTGPMLVLSCVVAVALLVSGTFYFKRTERTLADVV